MESSLASSASTLLVVMMIVALVTVTVVFLWINIVVGGFLWRSGWRHNLGTWQTSLIMLIVCRTEFCKFIFLLFLTGVGQYQVLLLLSLQVYDASLLLLLQEQLLHVPLHLLHIIADPNTDWFLTL